MRAASSESAQDMYISRSDIQHCLESSFVTCNQAKSEIACIGTIHLDQLLIDEFLDSQLRQFATVSRVFDSAERNIRGSPSRAVYENHSRVDLHRKSLR